MGEPSSKDPSGIYRYVDDSGHTLIADSLEAIPEAYRAVAERATLPEAKAALVSLERALAETKTTGLARARKVKREVGDVAPFVEDLDGPSVAVGFALALSLFVVRALLRRTGRVFWKLLGALAVLALVAAAYFGWLRRTAGVGDGAALSSPQQIVRDAKEAARALQARLNEQRRTLERLEKESR